LVALPLSIEAIATCIKSLLIAIRDCIRGRAL